MDRFEPHPGGPRRWRRWRLPLLLAAVTAAGAAALFSRSAPAPARSMPTTDGAPCEVLAAGLPLPADADESSGLARGLRDPGIFWTHNDAGNSPHLFAVDTAGRLRGRVRVTDAELVDWEDVEAAPCDAGACLFIGDIGDNDADRDRITIYRVAEPAPDDAATTPADPLHARYPDGPRDAEGLLAHGGGSLYIVTKGRAEEVALYRYPSPHRPGATATLERVRTLFPPPGDRDDRITAATATRDGRYVAVRSYRTLFIYPADALLRGEPVEPAAIDLSELGEPQGEAVVVDGDGTVWLSTEAGDGEGPRWSRLRCELSPPPAPRPEP